MLERGLCEKTGAARFAARPRPQVVPGPPSIFPIDAQGRIVRAMAGGAEWDSHAAVRLIRHYLEAGGGESGVREVGAGISPVP